MKKNKGITLIALVITIIVLLIIAGVSIAMLTGENGILIQAIKAKENTEQAAKNEAAALNSIEDYLNEHTGQGNGYLKSKGVNAPKLVTGMHEVMFKLPEGNNKGEVIEKGQTGFDENNWYDYQKSQWANARTEDGSYWVWIPRYAYKITYKNPSNKSEGGSIDVKFLVGTTDQYYDGNGQLQTAKRATSATEVVDTTSDYYVHPAFTDESKISFANGGWDKELTGIWIAKFEAGYASGNNNTEVRESSIKYSTPNAWVAKVESDTQIESNRPARNWLDGIYGGKSTTIKYPTFQPKTYGMNYININDAHNISQKLTENNNIYGLKEDTDSHLIKNSEWGAVVYLGYSKYGSNGVQPYSNNISLNSGSQTRTEVAGKNGVDSVYAVTGVTTATANKKTTTIENINGTIGNNAKDGVYVWNQIEGQKASTTLNMYGIYDITGGAWERSAAYIANERNELKNGHSLTFENGILKTNSSKYVTVYPFNKDADNINIDKTNENFINASKLNYQENNYIFGDAIREISSSGSEITTWDDSKSGYAALYYPFFMKSSWNSSSAGTFNFDNSNGSSTFANSFRTVLIAK